MKTAGRAFTAGLFGTFGVAFAILGTAGVVVLVGERKIKRVVSEFETYLKAKTDELMKENEE